MGWKDAPVVDAPVAASGWQAAPLVEEDTGERTLSPQLEKMLAMGDRPELTFPQYAGKALKEIPIPMATTAAGAATGGLGGAMAGSALGETVNQALGVYGKSVMPGVDHPDLGRVGIAGVAPAVIPALAKTAQGVKWLGGKATDAVKQAMEPLSEKGREVILARFRAKLANHDPKLLAQLADAADNAPVYVPGSNPTAAQAISGVPGSTGFAAHENQLSRMPGVSTQFADRTAQQEAARSAAMAPIAGTQQDLANAVETRATDAGALYEQAYNVIFQGKLPKSLATNPYIKEALPDAVKLAQANGIDPKTNLTEFLHFVKIGLDKQLARTGDLALHNTEKAAVQSAKENLLGWLKQKNPLYDQARQRFADLSVDPNRMQVGQYLQSKLDSPLETVGGQSIPQSERAAQFAQAIADAPRTIKTATGRAVAKDLGDVLAPKDVQTVEGIIKDLARNQATKKLAGRTSIAGADAVPGDVGGHLPNLLYRPAMVANYVMKKMGASAEDLIGQSAATQHLDKAEFAKALRLIPQLVPMGAHPPSRYDQIVQAILNRQAPVAAGVATQQ